jgi:hypothetical protein
VIQINPRRWDGEPQSMVEIADRRNELAGNLSLHQELRFIEKVDQLLEEGRLARDGKYKQIVVRLIELIRPSQSRSLGTASKLNRDPAFLRELIDHGEARAEEFLAALAFEDAWRRRDPEAVLACFADDAELHSGSPFPDRGTLRGRGRSASSSASTSPPTYTSTRPGPRWPATGSRGLCGPTGTTRRRVSRARRRRRSQPAGSPLFGWDSRNVPAETPSLINGRTARTASDASRSGQR